MRLRFIKTHTPPAIFALTFGLMQGGLIALEIVHFMAPIPTVLLGIIVASTIIYLIKEKSNSYEDIDTMHRIALFLLILGVIGLAFLKWVDLGNVSKAALLAGFNLFDFAALALSLGMARRVGLIKVHYIDLGRALVYLGFTLGLAFGFFGCRAFDSSYSDMLLNSIGGIAIVLVTLTMLLKLDKKAPTELALIEEPSSSAAQAVAVDNSGVNGDGKEALERMSWQEACSEVSKTYRLSPREIEVFMCLARGRNAEYIQGKLVISLHTAKSHIANIYQKLGVHSIQEMLDLVDVFMMK